MTIFTKILRCLCMCIVLEKGSWSPNDHVSRKAVNKNHRAIIQNRLKDNKTTRNTNKEFAKPEWLKQWTISKGWMHNRSHLLNLGRESNSSENLVMETPQLPKKLDHLSLDVDERSSVSFENIEDLISETSNNFETKGNENNSIEIITEEKVCEISEDCFESVDYSLMFAEVSQNYRQNFPDNYYKYNTFSELSLPEIYKEKLLQNKQAKSNALLDLFKELKPKRKHKEETYKYTVNELYDDDTNFNKNHLIEENIKNQPKYHKSTLGKNITLYNTLNSKTNLHEDTIYECSEEGVSLYNNPIYEPISFTKQKFYGFQTNHVCNKNDFKRNSAILRKRYAGVFHRSKNDSLKYKLKSEKYIIRHIRIRIMLSLRLGRFRKVKRNVRSGYKQFFRNVEFCEDATTRGNIAKMHWEQKKIGNGRTSMKIQNMR